MQYSHSRIECFEKCPHKYKLRYVDGLRTLGAPEADDALILGTALHTGLERGVEAAVEQYKAAFPILTDAHIDEIIKLETVIPMAASLLPPGGKFEVKVEDGDFLGFIDYLAPNSDGTYDIWDFKYSNNVERYEKSPQLSLYAYFTAKVLGVEIKSTKFLFAPKVQPRQKKTESLGQFRHRLREALACVSPKILEVKYDPEHIIEFFRQAKRTLETAGFCKNVTALCKWCEYQKFCEEGEDYMILPENKRREIESVTRRVLWIYGAPFCGKTTFANAFPDPLMLNTDGNIKFVDAPYIRIRDEVSVEGRITKRVFAWQVFKDAITELEKKQNTFKTIVVDLLEDLYEYCRAYMYDKLGITHESDDSFRAWDKVRGEFLHTLKRLMNLDYENIILISHEDTSKDVTRSTGDKVTAIKPNVADKIANKVAGMVDVVARIVATGDKYTFSFKSNDMVFGGGRLKVSAKDIPLDAAELFKVYDEANALAAKAPATARREEPKAEPPKEEPSAEPPAEPPKEEPPKEEPPKRRRRKTEEEAVDEPIETVEDLTEFEPLEDDKMPF